MKTLLLIDDSRSARMMFKHWVITARPGLQVLEAGDGLQALEVLASLKGETVVFMDHNMPGVHGLDLARQLLEFVPANRLVMCTATIGTEIATKVEAMGMHYLAKPINPAKLVKTLEELGL